MNFKTKYTNSFVNNNLNNMILNYTRMIFVIWFLFLFAPFKLLQNEVDEKDLIIAYIERFTRFITNEKFSEFDNPKIPFNIYVYGENIFGSGLEEAYKTQKIKNRNVKIYYIDKIDEIKNANLIFICTSKKGDLQKISEIANQNGILTISYSKGFAEQGIHINLFQKDNRLKFEINLKSAQMGGFNISHLLLSNAKIVE